MAKGRGGSKALTGILCFIFGFIFAIIAEVAVIAGGVYFLMSADIDKILSTVGVENTDENGNQIYINTDVATGGVEKISDLVEKLRGFADKGADNLTLGDMTALFPIADTGIDRVYSTLADALSGYDITESDLRGLIDEDELKATPISQLGQFISDSSQNMHIDMILRIGGIDVSSNVLYLNMAYGSEAAVMYSASGEATVLYADSFTVESTEEGDEAYVRSDGAVLPAELESYVVSLHGGAEYVVYYSVSEGGAATVAMQQEDGSFVSAVPYTLYSAQTAALSGGYYFDKNDELVVLSNRTIADLREGEDGIFSVLDDVYVTDILSQGEAGSDDRFISMMEGITLGDLLDGNVDFDGIMEDVTVPTFINITPEDAIMMYVGYSITDVEPAEGQSYAYTGIIRRYAQDENGQWTEDETLAEECFIEVGEDGFVSRVYTADGGEESEYEGVGVMDIGVQTANITGALTVGDVIDITEDDQPFMQKLAGYKIADIGTAIDELYLSDFLGEVRVSDGLMSYIVYGIIDIQEVEDPSAVPEGVTHTATYMLIGEDGEVTEVHGVYLVTTEITETDEEGQPVKDYIIERVYYTEEGAEIECFTSINNVSGRIDGLREDLTVEQLIGEIDSSNTILYALRGSTINSLAGDINNLTIQNLFAEEIYGDGESGAVMTRYEKPGSEDDFHAEWLYYTLNEDGEYVLLDSNNDGNGDGRLTYATWEDGAVYYSYGAVNRSGAWELLLYNNGVEVAYSINNITNLQNNVLENLQKATLYDLADMGIIVAPDEDTDIDEILGSSIPNHGVIGNLTIGGFIAAVGSLPGITSGGN